MEISICLGTGFDFSGFLVGSTEPLSLKSTGFTGSESAAFDGIFLDTSSFLDGTILETSSFLDGTILETSSFLDGTILETSSFLDGTILETSSFLDGTILEAGPCSQGFFVNSGGTLFDDFSFDKSFLDIFLGTGLDDTGTIFLTGFSVSDLVEIEGFLSSGRTVFGVFTFLDVFSGLGEGLTFFPILAIGPLLGLITCLGGLIVCTGLLAPDSWAP